MRNPSTDAIKSFGSYLINSDVPFCEISARVIFCFGTPGWCKSMFVHFDEHARFVFVSFVLFTYEALNGLGLGLKGYDFIKSIWGGINKMDDIFYGSSFLVCSTHDKPGQPR